MPMRQLDILLDAMVQLEKQNYPINLLLIGDGPDISALENQAKRQGLSVHFYGSCYNETVLSRLFMASDLMVMPGRIGLAAMHSLAYGIPVVVHDNPDDQGPEWESIIPGYNGAHFAHTDSKDLAKVLRLWLENKPDRKLMRERCHEILTQFYNPITQARLIERAVSGEPADDWDWKQFLERKE